MARKYLLAAVCLIMPFCGSWGTCLGQSVELKGDETPTDKEIWNKALNMNPEKPRFKISDVQIADFQKLVDGMAGRYVRIKGTDTKTGKTGYLYFKTGPVTYKDGEPYRTYTLWDHTKDLDLMNKINAKIDSPELPPSILGIMTVFLASCIRAFRRVKDRLRGEIGSVTGAHGTEYDTVHATALA